MSFLKLSGGLKLRALSTAPSNPEDGSVYYNVLENKFKFYENGTWKTVATADDIPVTYITSANNTDSIALNVDSGNLTATLKLSPNSADNGRTKVDLSIENNGLLAQFTTPNAAEWGQITGDLEDQVDLQLALDAKQDSLGFTPEDSAYKSTSNTLGTSDTLYPSQRAVKEYVDNSILAATPEAVNVSYDNTDSELTALNVQDAIDETVALVKSLPDPITYKGSYDASSNTPVLSNGDTGVSGFLYRVSVAGTQDFGGGDISFEVGDSVVNNGTVWEKWDHTDQVLSVNSQTGAVVLDSDDISEGSTNLYFTDSRAKTATVVDSMAGTQTDQAPSVQSVKNYISSNQGISAVVDDTSPELGGDLDVNNKNIVSTQGVITLELGPSDSIVLDVSSGMSFTSSTQVNINSESSVSIASTLADITIQSQQDLDLISSSKVSINSPEVETKTDKFVLQSKSESGLKKENYLVRKAAIPSSQEKFFSFQHSLYDSVEIKYKARKGTAIRFGSLIGVSNGTNCDINGYSAETSLVDINFTIQINGSNTDIYIINDELSDTVNAVFDINLYSI